MSDDKKGFHIGVSFGMVDDDPKGLLEAELADMKLQKHVAEKRIAEIEEELDDMGRKKVTMEDIEVMWAPWEAFSLGPVMIMYQGQHYGYMRLNGNVTPYIEGCEPLKVVDLEPEKFGLTIGRADGKPALIYNPEKHPNRR
jgi:hypothetical protein